MPPARKLLILRNLQLSRAVGTGIAIRRRNQTNQMKKQNTYSLLLSAEEKGRSIFESAIYGLVVICTAFTGWAFVSSAVTTPGMNRATTTTTAPVAVEVLADATGTQAGPVVASN